MTANWLWIAAFVLLAVAGVSLFIAFQRPGFVAGLAKIVSVAFWQAFAPKLFKRMSPDEEKAWRERQRRAETGRQDRR